MYLRRLAALNYKSCQQIVLDLQKDNPNTFIGINDSGKSAILKSIGLLLDLKAPFNFSNESRSTSDVSNSCLSEVEHKKVFGDLSLPVFPYLPDSAFIVGEFVIEDGEITDDFIEKASPQLKWAIESIGQGTVTVLKHYEKNNTLGKYYICIGDTDPSSALWNKKDKDLQALKKDNSLTDDEIRNDNKKGRFANLEIVRALYNKKGYKPAWAEWSSFIKGDSELFPRYRYIDWNTSLSDVENLANDVMKAKIETSKAQLAKAAGELSEEATKDVNKEFESLTHELTKDLTSINAIKARVTFTVSEKVSDITINKSTSDGDIRLDSQGEGVKRQILFAFLKWASKKDGAPGRSKKNFIWCFDEPESHLYPVAQRDLQGVIKDLAKEDYQVFLGTHSTIFVDRFKLTDIHRFKLVNGYTEVSKCQSIDDVHDSLGVKNSDILFFDKFLVVEGESEAILVPHFYKLQTGRSFEEDSIKLIPLGGAGQYKRNKQILEEVLSDFKKTDGIVCYIFDADTAEVGVNVHLIGVCDLEDLIPNSLWLRLVRENCGISLTDADLDGMRTQLNAADATKKLHKMIADKVARDSSRTNYLPSKTQCADILQTYITDRAAIPSDFQTIFSSIAST